MKLVSLTKLAQELLANGPHKLEKTSRRVRALYDNIYIFDTTEYVFRTTLCWTRCLRSVLGVSQAFFMYTIGLTARL